MCAVILPWPLGAMEPLALCTHSKHLHISLTSSTHQPRMSAAAVAMPSTQAKSQGMLGGASKTCTYRRSTLTRAPRKRTFIANMEKFNSRSIDTGASPQLAKAYASVSGLLETCQGGNDNNNGRNNNGNGNNNNNDWSSFFGGDWESNPITLPRTIMLGLLAAFFAMTFMPSQAAASASATASISAAGMPARRHVPATKVGTRAATAVTKTAPSTASNEASQMIVYGQVHLTELEIKLLTADTRQMFFRETLRSEAIRI